MLQPFKPEWCLPEPQLPQVWRISVSATSRGPCLLQRSVSRLLFCIHPSLSMCFCHRSRQPSKAAASSKDTRNNRLMHTGSPASPLAFWAHNYVTLHTLTLMDARAVQSNKCHISHSLLASSVSALLLILHS